MSETGLVVVIAVLALAAGLGAAIRVFPASPATSSGAVVFWVSRITAAAAAAVLALDLYTTIKHQTLDEADTFGGDVAPLTLARDLSAAFFEAAVLASLAAGLALLGAWLLRREEGNVLDDDR
ncbi:MAG: hypothetical protein WD844_08180 [Thermoleophilaceae bacterium]